MVYVGLDYHTKWSYLTILGDGSEEVVEAKLDSRCELAEFLGKLPDAKVLFEAGYGWPRLAKILEEIDVELSMCHPESNRRIACDRRKSDRRDSRNLAVYLKTGTYKPAYMPDEAVRDERQFVRGRTYLSWKITRVKNQIHSLLAYAGIPKESEAIFAMKRRSYLETVKVPEQTREILDVNIRELDFLTEQLAILDKRIVEMNRNDPLARLLKTIPGIGDISARVILAEIGDIARFPTDKSLACFTGLTPKQHQSGNTMRTMGITKEGSSHMRWVYVQAAWIALRFDPALREYYEGLEKEKGAQKAICAVAHKLAIASWHILTKRTPYRPQRPKAEGKPAVARGKSTAPAVR
jgi:transposase